MGGETCFVNHIVGFKFLATYVEGKESLNASVRTGGDVPATTGLRALGQGRSYPVRAAVETGRVLGLRNRYR